MAAPKTWKRDPKRIEIPFKYGMYEYGTFDARDIQIGELLVVEPSTIESEDSKCMQ